ncbi:arsenate-mycothiol transferase ArsC [Halopiger aswanensis]|uniref:Protein-tyrosine-phosphatase n=1 Tax=Halopiger aswanensis TaxID=148449 RepID=A0A3R7DEE8_9EURY|nr:low molecular weight phosphatase family protein [Halopiger aswanensis]RKD97144.1 protein-tyrosine-phosphatase [Halopiger aswanensis]
MSTDHTETDSEPETDSSTTTVAFVCVQNAGRSQMATAFAERERERRDADIDIVSGGTDPADTVHEEVVTAMGELGIDLSDRTPREITPEDLQDCEYVITMGCSAEGVCPATWSGENRDWDLTDPHGADEETVREIRDEIESRVEALFDEL